MVTGKQANATKKIRGPISANQLIGRFPQSFESAADPGAENLPHRSDASNASLSTGARHA
jgi:hypothetical protein